MPTSDLSDLLNDPALSDEYKVILLMAEAIRRNNRPRREKDRAYADILAAFPQRNLPKAAESEEGTPGSNHRLKRSLRA